MDSCTLREARGGRGWRRRDGTKGGRRDNLSPFRGVVLSVLASGGRRLHPRPFLFLPFPIHRAAVCLCPFLRRGGGVELGRPHPRSAHYRGDSDSDAAQLLRSVRSPCGCVGDPSAGEPQRAQRLARVYTSGKKWSHDALTRFWVPLSRVKCRVQRPGVLSHCWNGSG